MIPRLGVFGTALFGLALLFTYRDLLRSTGDRVEATVDPIMEKAPKLKTFAVPTIKFLYWSEYAQMIRQRYPSVEIQGDNYPPTAARQTGAQILGVVKIVLIIAIVSGQNPFQMIGVETPQIYDWAINNKLSSCMMLFFIGNAIEGQLISTGAFEVSFNDQPIWSKLESGRVPQAQEMFQIIDNQMRMARVQ